MDVVDKMIILFMFVSYEIIIVIGCYLMCIYVIKFIYKIIEIFLVNKIVMFIEVCNVFIR